MRTDQNQSNCFLEMFKEIKQQINQLSKKVTQTDNKIDWIIKFLSHNHPSANGHVQGIKRQIQFPSHEGVDVKHKENVIKKIDTFKQTHLNQQNLLQFMKPVFTKMGLEFINCEQVYKYPKMTNNFHEHIDNKNNLMLVAELQNSQIIGAFTHLCFDPKPNYIPKQNSKSFISNLNRKRYLFAQRINKTHSYDKNYLIFGNWEIKIKCGEKYIESDLGTKGDCFAKLQFKGEEILKQGARQWIFCAGSEERKFQMKEYSIYIFK